ncbi:MAG: PEP-CTERM sorting domain-containing protein, partial [Planctomycetota bacterium]
VASEAGDCPMTALPYNFPDMHPEDWQMLFRPVRASSRFRRIVFLIAAACAEQISSSSASELLVTDRATGRVVAFDAVTGAFTRLISDGMLSKPSAITIGANGIAYVAHEQDETGLVGQVVAIDLLFDNHAPFLSDIAPAGGLAYDHADDTLFVSEFGVQFNGELVYQYQAVGETAGQLLTTIGAGSGESGRAGMTIGSDGDLYVSSFAAVEDFFSGAVLRFDRDDEFAPLGVYASQAGFGGFNGIGFDSEGNLYAAGLFSQNVAKFPPSGGVDSGAQLGEPLAYPSGILVGDDGTILISSLGNDNPADPIYPFLFPGAIWKYDTETGEAVGGAPFIAALGENLMADFDENDLVDGGDLEAWEMAFGTDDHGGADFLLWQRFYGSLGDFIPTSMALYSPTATGGVPEPSSLLLTLAGALILARHASRRRA